MTSVMKCVRHENLLGTPWSFGLPITRKLHKHKAGLETTLDFHKRGAPRTQLVSPLSSDPLPAPRRSPATQMLQWGSSNTTYVDQIYSSPDKISSLLDYQMPSFAFSTITQVLIQEKRFKKRKREESKKMQMRCSAVLENAGISGFINCCFH